MSCPPNILVGGSIQSFSSVLFQKFIERFQTMAAAGVQIPLRPPEAVKKLPSALREPQDERLSLCISNCCDPFVVRFSNHERIFSQLPFDKGGREGDLTNLAREIFL